MIGWRGAFFCLIPFAAIALAWKAVSLPPMASSRQQGGAGVFALLKRPAVALGMAAVGLLFMGQFALFTYLRPFLETVTRVEVSTLSLMLLLVGVAGFVGTTLIGAFLKDGLYRTLVAMPLLMAAIGVALLAFGHSSAIVTLLLGGWGLIATAAPVGWWTWLARSLPQDAEAGGGLMVAVVQLSIALGATVGGVLFDASGYALTFGASVVVLILAALLAVLAGRAAGKTAG
jgi:predicted MFS family arabinose efflux permease